MNTGQAAASTPLPRLISIQTGRVAPLAVARGTDDVVTVQSGIRKQAVSTLAANAAVAVGRLGLAGDEQSDLTVHGGLDKAVYAYPGEHYAFWQRQLGRPAPLPNGSFGENLTLAGLLETELWIGDELHFPHCVLVVESPRRPCYKLNALLDSNLAGKLMVEHGLTGWYLSVLETGSLSAGESCRLVAGPRRVSLGERQAQLKRPADLR